jgi:hypothetical protein
MEPEGSLPHSQVTASCPYPRPARSSPYPHILFPQTIYVFPKQIRRNTDQKIYILLELTYHQVSNVFKSVKFHNSYKSVFDPHSDVIICNS